MSLPRMSWHIGDYKKDTGHLRALGHGAYFLLCMHYWATGGLPDDDEQLAAIACMTHREWKKHGPIIKRLFKGEGAWVHKRVEEELADAQAKYEKRVAAGSKGGKAKAMAQQCSSNTTAEPYQPITDNPNQKKEKEDTGAVAPTAGKPKREKKYKTQLSDGFQPNWEAATRVGLSKREAEREFQKFKNHAGMNDRTCVNWQLAWANWCINSAQYLKKPPPGHSSNSAATITPASRSWNAWKAHFRDNNDNVRASMMDKCADEGRAFTVSSEWPPGHEMNDAA